MYRPCPPTQLTPTTPPPCPHTDCTLRIHYVDLKSSKCLRKSSRKKCLQKRCSSETRLVSVKIGFRLKNLSAQPHFRVIIMHHVLEIGYESRGQGYAMNLIGSAISRIPLWVWPCLISKAACPLIFCGEFSSDLLLSVDLLQKDISDKFQYF